MLKKRLALLLALLLLLSVLPVTALAATPTTRADMLKDLGLFQGTPTGYQLDRAPTRAEAAVMLVRALGKTDAATSAAYKTPFTDVPDWAADAVGYLYHEGLTKGTGATKYSANRACEAKMYVTFILRALGYSDTWDFKYDWAVMDAVDLDVLEAEEAYFLDDSEVFLRGDMVDITWSALSAKVKGTQTMLLDKLVTDGAVVESKATKYRDELTAFAAVRTAMLSVNANPSAFQVSEKTSMTIKSGIVSITSTEESTTKARQKANGSWDLLREDKMSSLGSRSAQGLYVKDNWLYTSWPDGSKEKYEINDSAELLYDLPDLVSVGSFLPFTFKTTRSTTSGRVSEYILNMTEALAEMSTEQLTEMFGDLDSEELSAAELLDTLKSMDYQTSLENDAQGRLTGFKMTMSFNMEIEGEKVAFATTSEATIGYSTADIVFPSLTGYTTMSNGPMELYDAYMTAMGYGIDEDESW